MQGAFAGASSISNGLLPFLATLWFKATSSDTSSNNILPPSIYAGLAVFSLVGAVSAILIPKVEDEDDEHGTY